MTNQQTEIIEHLAHYAGRYLVFSLGEQEYGIPLESVMEIVGILPITRVPNVPDFIPGVINLRGRIVPVADLGMRFSTQRYVETERTCVVVVRSTEDSGHFGVIVENVPEVLDLTEELLEEPPDMGNASEMRFIQAMAKWQNERVIMLLDLLVLFDTSDFEMVSRKHTERIERGLVKGDESGAGENENEDNTDKGAEQ